MSAHNQQIGARGEHVAAGWVRNHGMRVLATNWRCPAGEIDIVAQDGATLVVVEVKTRTSTRFGSPAEAVAGVKLRRLRRLAAQFLAQCPHYFPAVRIDVIAVLLPPGGGALVRHLRSVT